MARFSKLTTGLITAIDPFQYNLLARTQDILGKRYFP